MKKNLGFDRNLPSVTIIPEKKVERSINTFPTHSIPSQESRNIIKRHGNSDQKEMQKES